MKNPELGKITFIIATAALAASVSFALYALFLAPAGIYSPPAVGAGRAVVEADPCDESSITAPEDIPEGWTWHVFFDACIGFAFPTTDDGVAYEMGEGDGIDWNGKLVQVWNNEDFKLSTRNMDVLVVELFQNSKIDHRICVSRGYPAFVFCLDEIENEWMVLDSGDGWTSYILPPDQLPEQFVSAIVAHAATITDGGLLVTFNFIDDTTKKDDTDEEETLKKIVSTLSIGS